MSPIALNAPNFFLVNKDQVEASEQPYVEKLYTRKYNASLAESR